MVHNVWDKLAQVVNHPIVRKVLEVKDKIRITDVDSERIGKTVVLYIWTEDRLQAQLLEQTLVEILKYLKGGNG